MAGCKNKKERKRTLFKCLVVLALELEQIVDTVN